MAHHEYPSEDVGNNPADQQYRETPPGAAYEHTDASVWTIVKFGLWLAIAAVIIHVGLGFMYAMMIERAKTSRTRVTRWPVRRRRRRRRRGCSSSRKLRCISCGSRKNGSCRPTAGSTRMPARSTSRSTTRCG